MNRARLIIHNGLNGHIPHDYKRLADMQRQRGRPPIRSSLRFATKRDGMVACDEGRVTTIVELIVGGVR